MSARWWVVLGASLLMSGGCKSSSTSSSGTAVPSATAAARPIEGGTSATAGASSSAVAPSTPAAAPRTGPMRFTWTDFHFEFFDTAVMEVEDGKVTELFPDARQKMHRGQPVTAIFFRLARYELSDDEAKALREALSSDAFWALKDRYINREIEDGTTQTFSVSFGSSDPKRVECYQEWPAPVQRVREVIGAIRSAHADVREKAEEADEKTAKAMRARAGGEP